MMPLFTGLAFGFGIGIFIALPYIFHWGGAQF